MLTVSARQTLLPSICHGLMSHSRYLMLCLSMIATVGRTLRLPEHGEWAVIPQPEPCELCGTQKRLSQPLRNQPPVRRHLMGAAAICRQHACF